MKMKWILLLLLAVYCNNDCWGQKDKSKQSILGGMHHVEDVVYMYGRECLLSKSFFSTFEGYKKLFPELPPFEKLIMYGQAGQDFEMNYKPIWLIENKILYLVGICIYSADEDKISITERFARVEKMTGKKFSTEYLKQETIDRTLIGNCKSVGSMKATWVNGVFYLKTCYVYNEDYGKWKKEPINKVTFKNGRVISVRNIYE